MNDIHKKKVLVYAPISVWSIEDTYLFRMNKTILKLTLYFVQCNRSNQCTILK